MKFLALLKFDAAMIGNAFIRTLARERLMSCQLESNIDDNILKGGIGNVSDNKTTFTTT